MAPWADPTTHLLALVSSACFAVVYRTPRRYFPLTVAVTYATTIGIHSAPAAWNVGFSSLVAAFFLGSASQLMARATGAPAQCFLIPGVMALVPGTYIYRSFSAALEKRLDDAAVLGLTAVTITVGISFGILIANWIFPTRRAV